MRPICYDFDVIFWLKRQGKLKWNSKKQ
jgi:hypothetical protein